MDRAVEFAPALAIAVVLLGLAGYAVALILAAFRGAVVVPSEAELV
jgi:hypothetical protein